MSETHSSPKERSTELKLSTKGLKNVAALGLEDFLRIPVSDGIDLYSVSEVLSLSRGGSIALKSSNFKAVWVVAKGLGNSELCEQLMNFAREAGELTLSNVNERFSLAESLGVSPSSEIAYLASHFYEVNLDILNGLNHACLSEALRSDQLQIHSEDSLLDFILELGRDYFDLLGTVRSEYLSVSGIDRLLNAISIDDIDVQVWSSLCGRL